VGRVIRRLLAASGLALVGLLVAPAPSALAVETIPSYDVRIDVRANGTFHIREEIAYDFGTAQRHGIFRTIPVRYTYDDTRDRVVTIKGLRVVSTTGAPSGVQTSTESANLVVRVGDPDRTVTGRQVYVLDYDVSGALNAFPDHAELYWNAVGPEWEAAIDRVTVRVSGPVPVTRSTCVAGYRGAEDPCQQAAQDGGAATFAQSALGPYQGVTVVVAWPPGSVAVPGPDLEERFSLGRAFSATPWTVAGALAVVAIGLGGIGYLLWTRGRDRRYRGEVPGLKPVAGQVGVEEPRPLFTPAAGAVEFRPPEGVRPGQVGTLLDEVANPLDVTATIVDLAVRGYLHIEELERAHLFASRDWVFRQRKPADAELVPYERTLLDAIFTGRSEVRVSELKRTFASDLAKVQKQLYADVVAHGWFRRSPQTTRTWWRLIGIGCVVVGAGLTYLLARYTHAGLLGVAAVLSGLVLLLVARRMPARTAAGSAELARVLGFRQYIRTAEAEQLRFEERTDVFSRYLPYAVVFGETERWAKAFASLAAVTAAGGAGQVLPWYSGPGGWDFGRFGDSMRSFSDTTAGAIAATAASSGGSGFSGGSSGGGFGGGGGGSW